jgi:dephospho-CoA kinase
LFSADTVVKKLYSKKGFRRFIAKKLNFQFNLQFSKILKSIILEKKESLKKLEKIIHPLVRKSMHTFSKKNKSQKLLFFEIPLLVESKLLKHFDVVIFIKSKKGARLKRYMSKKGNANLFHLLDSQQMKDSIKMKFCDYIVVNNSSLNVLKRNLLNIIKFYE